jgi:ATP-binding cassette subfamily B protein
MPELRRLLPYLARYKPALAAGMVCLFAAKLVSVLAPQVLRYAVDDLTVSVTTRKLALYAGLIVGIALVEGVFRYFMRKLLIGVSRYVEYDLRNAFFAHLERMSPSFYSHWRTGDLMSRAANDISAVRMVLGPGIMYPAETIVVTVASLGFMIAIDWQLTVLSLALMPVVSIAVKKFGEAIHSRFESIQAKMSDLSALVQENLSGMRVVKAYGQEESEKKRFNQENQEYLRRNIELVKIWGLFYPLMSTLIGLATVLVLWWGGRLVVSGRLSLGELVAFFAYLSMLTWPMIAFGWVVNIYQRGAASMKRLTTILDQAPGIREKPVAAASLPEIRGQIEFRRVHFRHNGTPILEDVNLRIEPGQTVAIVGPTGSGKTTLVSLVPRLYDVSEGQVLLDGVDVRELPLARVRGAVGFVAQESFLFSTTVQENIGFGGAAADLAAVERSAKVAGLAGDVAEFAEGYQTMVGERGITLSGGQKQRTAIARSLFIDPRILILDDALSSVDTETEERILNELAGVLGQRTALLVSHRISTIRGADLIVVLDHGRIVERGRHQELIDRDGLYAGLYRKQLLEEELERLS